MTLDDPSIRQRVVTFEQPRPDRRFVANKNPGTIQQPYDNLVEAIFPLVFDPDLADC
jgi:hypothetical protein